jgi:tyrosine-protein kinase Etk/Wzc
MDEKNSHNARAMREQSMTVDIAEDEIDIRQYLNLLVQEWWLIVLCAVLAVSAAGSYAFLSTPIYQVDAMLQVEDKKGGIADITDMSSLLDPGSSTDAEIELIRSRFILGKVVHDLNLEVTSLPVVLPIIGAATYRYHMDIDKLSWLLDTSKYAAGGEFAKVDRLDVDDMWLGVPLTLVVEGNDRYRVEDEDGVLLVRGVVGQAANDNGVSLFVSAIKAHAKAHFTLMKRPWQQVVAVLQKSLSVTEKGKKTGILRIAYQSDDSQQAMQIVDAVAHAYLRQNVERKSEEASRALVFLQQQLPEVRARMDASESALNSYRLQQGSVDIGIETQGILSQLVDLDGRLSAIDLKRAEMTERFQSQHPIMQALDKQTAKLKQEKLVLSKKISNLPETEQKILTLTRDVKVNTELYTALLDKTQELKVVKAGTIGNVRIIDLAVKPFAPVKPKKGLIIALGLVSGLFLGVLLVFMRQAMRSGVEDPEVIEQELGLSVYASIPHSETQESLAKMIRKKLHLGKAPSLLACKHPKDLAIEGLRSMRTNLRFSLLDSNNNIVVLSGPSPDLGKSFVSSNLAYVLADAGQRVLLIDGDMRKGHLHDYFGMGRESGLSGLLAGEKTLAQAIHPTMHDKLFIMPTGIIPPNPAELLMSPRFEEMLETVSADYDIVFIDTPPVLAVTDAAVIARRAGAFFMLLRSGKNPMREIKQAVRHIKNSGIDVSGVLLNDIMPKKGYGYGNYGYYYQYAYGTDDKKS